MDHRRMRREAIVQIDKALGWIESGRLDFGEWVSEKLAYAIGTLYCRQYQPAKAAAQDVFAPRSERVNFSDVPTHALATLRQAFDVARAQPICPYPQFGPIIFRG
jgi:hypothetical protein